MMMRSIAFASTWKLALVAGLFTFGAASVPFLQTTPAHAQDAPSFAEADQNIDGIISEDEFMAAFPDATADLFAAADGNADTVLTRAEYENAVSVM
ncbi:MAG: EF-hand domain-containing protein [Pseudomonadota bacterium]